MRNMMQTDFNDGAQPMQPRITRPFRISDALVLVAATGLGLAGCRFWLSANKLSWGDLWPTRDLSLVEGLHVAAVSTTLVLSILILSWTVGILVLRLRATHPRRRHLWCQPGFLACVATVFCYAWNSVYVGLLLTVELLRSGPAPLSKVNYWDVALQFALMLHQPYFGRHGNVGGAILLVWLVTWAGGRCRPEPSWIDRAGRALGVAWMGISLIGAFATFG
jgi:hypothetical protein